MSEDALTSLIESVHAAAIEPEGWELLMSRLEHTLKGPAALLTHKLQPTGVVAATIEDDQHSRPYLQHFWRKDVGNRALLRSPTGSIVCDAQFEGDADRAEFYSDYLGRFGLSQGVYASAPGPDGGLALLAAHRPAARGDYSREEIALLRGLLPHLGLSLRVQNRLAAAEVRQAACVDALEQARLGVILADADAGVRWMSESAEEALRGQGLSLSRGRLHATNAPATRRLHAELGRAVRDHQSTLVSIPLKDGGATQLTVAPVRPELFDRVSDRLALIVLAGAELDIDAGRLADSYALTPAEARLLGALVDGERLIDYADRAGVKLTTAKTHLRSLFQKTGENRQADLIRKAMLDPGLRLHVEIATP